MFKINPSIASLVRNQEGYFPCSYGDLLEIEKLTISLQNSFKKKKEIFIENLKNFKDELIKEFNKQHDIKIDLLFSDIFYEQSLFNIKKIPYTILYYSNSFEKPKILYYHQKTGFFTCDQEVITIFNIDKVDIFSISNFKKLINRIESYFKPIEIKLVQEKSNIKLRFSKIASFWDIELFFKEKLHLRFKKEVFYRYQDDDCANFYFVENSKNQIQIFIDQNCSEFVDQNMKTFKVLVNEFKKLDLFFKHIWNDGDNFEYEELGKLWKQRILESWKQDG